jgi:hypothetical protein
MIFYVGGIGLLAIGLLSLFIGISQIVGRKALFESIAEKQSRLFPSFGRLMRSKGEPSAMVYPGVSFCLVGMLLVVGGVVRLFS